MKPPKKQKVSHDEHTAAEAQAHSEKMSKWRAGACQALEDWAFLFVLLLAQRLLSVLQHFFAAVLRLPDAEVGETHASLARLVCGQANTLLRDHMVPLLQPSAWDDIVEKVPPEYASRCRGLCLAGARRLIGTYSQRIIGRISSGPYNLLWLGWEDPLVPCIGRQRVASELLERPSWALHDTARKVKSLFPTELRHTARTGLIDMNLFAPFKILGERWLAHVSELEGVNNMVKCLLSAAPRTSLVLADAEIGLRKDFGLGVRRTKELKWSQIAPRVEEILNQTVPYASAQLEIRSDISRFAEPLPAQRPPPVLLDGVELPAEIAAISLQGSFACQEDLVWARGYNAHWMKTIKDKLAIPGQDVGGVCIAIKAPAEDNKCWVVTHRYGHIVYLLKHDVLYDGGRLVPVDPPVCISSIELFTDFKKNNCLTDGFDVTSCMVVTNGEGLSNVENQLFRLCDRPHPSAAKKHTPALVDKDPTYAIMDDILGGGAEMGEGGEGYVEHAGSDVSEEMEAEEAADIEAVAAADAYASDDDGVALPPPLVEDSQIGVDASDQAFLDQVVGAADAGGGVGVEPSESEPVLSLDNCFALLACWVEAVQKTVKSLSVRADSLQQYCDTVPKHGGNMSLVEVLGSGSRSVELVSWQPGHRQGRLVPCEGARWKYVVGYGISGHVAAKDLRSASVVLPDCGIRMDKPKDFRSDLPDPCVHLKLIWEVGMAAQSGITMSITPCVLCRKHDAFRCAVCLLSWHDLCGRNLNRNLMQSESRAMYTDLIGSASISVEYPRSLLGLSAERVEPLCHLCRSVLDVKPTVA